MATLQVTSPLKWPSFLPLTDRLSKQNNSQFQLNMQEREAVMFLEDEISRTPHVASAVLSCDAINLTSTASTQYLSKNSGAALEVAYNGARYALACDRWMSLSHNIYVLHLALRSFRQLEDWGVAPLDVSLSSFRVGGSSAAATSAADTANLNEWQMALGLGPTATLEDANAIYRNRAKLMGESDPEQLQRLNLAIQEARNNLS